MIETADIMQPWPDAQGGSSGPHGYVPALIELGLATVMSFVLAIAAVSGLSGVALRRRMSGTPDDAFEGPPERPVPPEQGNRH